jgi:uncharacterized protein (DUF697 family)
MLKDPFQRLAQSWDWTAAALSRAWPEIQRSVLTPERASVPDEAIAAQARLGAPVIWLVGKVQSGKSSIVRRLTGASDADIGTGYRSCTRTARLYDYPPEAPVIRFLDTRGLGEAAYDPAEDLAFAQSQAHVLLVVMRAMDPAQGQLVDVVRKARRQHPAWPLLVAQTCLHEGYSPAHEMHQGHVTPYPFDASGRATAGSGVPDDLLRSLAHQRALFDTVPGHGVIRFVPLDFTRPDDGFAPADYGAEALIGALSEVAPAGLVEALGLSGTQRLGAAEAKAKPHIMGYAAAAGAADILPAAGLVAVPVIQGKLMHSLALIHGIAWDRRMLGEFAACLGAGTLARVAIGLGLRQLAKLIPVYGQTVGAAAAAATSFATTVALGHAANHFLAQRLRGITDPDGVARAYAQALAGALRHAPASALPR